MAHAPLYQTQDSERWQETPSRTNQANESETRTPFQIDRDRIIFSYAFRRLQSKTQVFQSGDYDFYRTRLTHSIEVAKIGRSIVERLNIQLQERAPKVGLIDADLVEATCLAHDLGHPPFGHIGERTLNTCMAPWGGFEGNAQTLRILTELIFDRPGTPSGMQPTRALLDSVLKYKQTYSERTSQAEDGTRLPPDNHFVYDAQSPILDWVHLGEELPRTKSLECQIMDWADDTAYSLNDLSDGIQAGYITPQRIHDWADQQSDLDTSDKEHITKLTRAIETHKYEPRHAKKIGLFIQSTDLKLIAENEGKGRYAWQVTINPQTKRECKIYKRIAIDLIFKSPQVQQSEYRGSYLLTRLFEALEDTYLKTNTQSSGFRILPERWDHRLRGAPDTASGYRILCDALSSFTDGEAIRLYQRLFRADYGSLSDMI